MAAVNLLKIFIVTATNGYMRPLFKCRGHQIRVDNILSNHQEKNLNIRTFCYFYHLESTENLYSSL